jgi:DNA repair protein RadC
MKVSSTVRRGADGKGAHATSPAAYPTKAALLANAAAIILTHNHPSGDVNPSADDVQLTRRLVDAGTLLGVDVLDHIIVGDGRYYSFKEGARL